MCDWIHSYVRHDSFIRTTGPMRVRSIVVKRFGGLSLRNVGILYSTGPHLSKMCSSYIYMADLTNDPHISAV